MTVDLVLDARAGLAEGPVWHDGGLLWVDVEIGLLHRLVDGEDAVIAERDTISAVAIREQGGLVLARPWGLEISDDATSIDLWRAPHDADRVRLNDMGCDPQGRLVVGSMDRNETDPIGSVHQVEPDGSGRVIRADVTVSNGIDWSPDGTTMWYTDSPTRRLDRYSYDPETGHAEADAGVAIDRPGVGDGLCVDAEGCVWVANWGGWAVLRYTPDGRLDRIVDIPASQVTSCAFGGSDLTTLFVTTARRGRTPDKLEKEPHAGGVFAFDAGVTGQPARTFAG